MKYLFIIFTFAFLFTQTYPLYASEMADFICDIGLEYYRQGVSKIVEFLKTFCPRVKLFGTIDDIQYLIHGGRLKLPKFLAPAISLFQKSSFRMVVELKDGKIKLYKVRLGVNLPQILSEEVIKEAQGKKIKAVIAHSGNQKAAEELKAILEKKLLAEIACLSQVSLAVGAHTGPGALIAAFYTIDK